mmetsp:Transcript_43418/g.169888  ORF Transcript_43418/g.169888 Transcript_43418/m.169888 type:complete len:122 (-) Transcript_43418:435-800(-)
MFSYLKYKRERTGKPRRGFQSSHQKRQANGGTMIPILHPDSKNQTEPLNDISYLTGIVRVSLLDIRKSVNVITSSHDEEISKCGDDLVQRSVKVLEQKDISIDNNRDQSRGIVRPLYHTIK